MLSYDEAAAAVTAPGERYELETIEVDGVTVRAFKHAPASLREIFASARDRGEETFLVYEDERWSFAEVMVHVDALAALLVDHYGVQPGDRVAIGMRNYPEWVISFAAITSIGAVSVSLNAWWTADELDYALDDCGATVLIADIERVERGLAACERLGCRILAVRSPGDLPTGVDRWEDLRRLGAPMPEVEVTADHDATILYTSGTTGHPKGAVSTHRAVVQALMGFGCKTVLDRLRRPPTAEAAAAALPPTFILIVPLFHVTGCVPVMLSCFASGLKLVMMYRWDADRALELIEREQVTNFVGVPTQSWDLLESPKFATADTSSLVSVGGGGAPAPPELVKRVASSFKAGKPNIGYGMTETN
ncbi:MAG: AMP-binding protein, partial [Acidimicrobiales bacterium]